MGKTVSQADRQSEKLKAMQNSEWIETSALLTGPPEIIAALLKTAQKRSTDKLFLLVVFYPSKARGDIWEDIDTS